MSLICTQCMQAFMCTQIKMAQQHAESKHGKVLMFNTIKTKYNLLVRKNWNGDNNYKQNTVVMAMFGPHVKLILLWKFYLLRSHSPSAFLWLVTHLLTPGLPRVKIKRNKSPFRAPGVRHSYHIPHWICCISAAAVDSKVLISYWNYLRSAYQYTAFPSEARTAVLLLIAEQHALSSCRWKAILRRVSSGPTQWLFTIPHMILIQVISTNIKFTFTTILSILRFCP